MRQCIDCRYSSPCPGNVKRYSCDKHRGTFDPFEHPVCSDYMEDDDGHNCFECEYYSTKGFHDTTGKCEKRNLKRARYDPACPYFQDY